MEEPEYRVMRACEDRHWWYRGLRSLLSRELEGFSRKDNCFVADVGCGTGGHLAFLSALMPGARLIGIDIHPLALQLTQARRTSSALVRGNASCLPFIPDVFDLVLCTDVLSFSGMDEKKALMECHRILKPGGFFLLNVPAFECLRGRHDEAVSTQRRYRKKHLGRLLRDEGFQPRSIFYWNSVFFPALFLKRKCSSFFKKEHLKSDLKEEPVFWNSFLGRSLALESRLSRRGFFCFGASLFAVCEKQQAAG